MIRDSSHVKKTLSKNLKKKLRAKRGKAASVSREINISEGTLSMYANGYNLPSLTMLLLICAALECTPNDLLLD